MKIGTFYEHQLPRPWEPGAELKLFQDALDQAELTDRLGFDVLWAVEHHFLEEYAHSSSPEVFLAAVSQRTTHLRLGHGIVLLPPAYNPPARVAERIATLDLVSKGRVEFGTGESSSEIELGGFGIPRGAKREMWKESLGAICRMMVEEPFLGHEGEHFNMPVRNVVPKPVQKPHPPLWVACSQRETMLLAARLGIGALTFAFISPEEARKWVHDYHETFAKECEPIGYTVNPSIALVQAMMCAPTQEKAQAMDLNGSSFFMYALGHYYFFGSHDPGKTSIWNSYRAARQSGALRAMLQQGSNGGGICVGTPAKIRAALSLYEEVGVDQVVFISQGGRNRHEDICESYNLFAREVMAEFKDRDPGLVTQKARRLEPIVEQVMKRKTAARAPKIEGSTIVKAGAGQL